MGRPRGPERPDQPQTGTQAEVAVALVGAAGASQAAFVAAVAPLLLAFVPPAILSDVEAAGDVAEGAAKLLYEADAVPVPRASFARTAALEAIGYRAAYAKAAVQRLSVAVLAAEPGERGEALRKALAAESRHLSAHLDATRRRLAGARVIDGLVELHGPVLGWAHGETGTPQEPRPNHLAADRKNWDTRRGIPVLTGALPGVLPFCTCGAVAPFPNAQMIV